MAEQLINKGVVVLNAPQQDDSAGDRPIVVLGVARGGTSMIAGALSHLGVYMGDRAKKPVFEDVRLAEAMEGERWREFADIAAEYGSRQGRWGFKRPSTLGYLPDIGDRFGKPVYVAVFKDLLAIAQRNNISMLSDIGRSLENAQRQYQQLLEFLQATDAPAMLVSYEKALAYPAEFVDQLASFCQLHCTDIEKKTALDFIEPAPAKYLDASRITKTQGRLGRVSASRLSGWARFVHATEPAVVEFFVNGQLVGEAEATGRREDLLKKYGENCAFSFNLPAGVNLDEGDEIRARVKGDVKDLNNSPSRVTPAPDKKNKDGSKASKETQSTS